MRIPALPPDEIARLADLQDYQVLDTPPERGFEELVGLAAKVCDTPYAALTLIDQDREWFLASRGIQATQLCRDESICAHAILQRGLFEVPDLELDERFAGNPLLGEPLRLRHYAGYPLVSPRGHALGSLCVADVCPRQLNALQRQALEQLATVAVSLLEARRQRRREEWFGALIDRVSEEITIIDAESKRYLLANRAALDKLGYTLEELRELTPVQVRPTLGTEQFRSILEQLEAGVPQVVYEGIRRRASGATYPVEVRVQRLQTSSRPVFVSIAHDISERKAIEKLKDDFISVVNHELRTPLTSVHGAIKLLESGAGGALPEPATRLVALASQNADRLRRIVDDILDLEKVACGRVELRLQPLDAAAQLQKAAQSQETVALPLGVKMSVDAAGALRLFADELRLQQVLGNLVSNALKFAPRGSTVELRACREGERVRLSVTDHGPGIPEHFRPKLFQRFAQAEMGNTRPQGGSGLGLAIVKQMTEQMGGRVGCESRPGCTMFYIELPGSRP